MYSFKSLNLVLYIVIFIAFAISQGLSSNIPAKDQPNRTQYQVWAGISGSIAYGGLLLLIFQSTAKTSPQGKVASILSNLL